MMNSQSLKTKNLSNKPQRPKRRFKPRRYKSNYEMMLHKLFRRPTLVLIDGVWKTGKTDTALRISEDLLKMNVISEVATNIYTYGHYEQITDLRSLDYWLHRNKRRKLYILDEANKHLPSRRAMSAKNVDAVQLLSELSKAHGRLIVIAQNLKKIDSEYKEQTWLRAILHKTNKKVLKVTWSRLLKYDYEFTNFRRTSIKFDKDTTAPLTQRPPKELMFKDEDMLKLYEWATGKTWRELFKHPQECNRFVKRNVKKLLDKYSPLHT